MRGALLVGVFDSQQESAAQFFEKSTEAAVKSGAEKKAIAKPVVNIFKGEIMRVLNEQSIEIEQTKLTPQHLADLATLFLKQTISNQGVKQALGSALKSGEAIGKIVEKEGLAQVSDMSAFAAIIDEIIAKNPAQVAEFRAGKDKLIGFFVGQVMKASGGKANPAMLQEIILKKLKS